MKKKKIRKRLEKAAKARQMCRSFTAGDSEEASRFLPLAISEELVYMIKDGDPEAYGYSVRSLDVIEKVKIEKEEEAPAEMAEKHASAAPELDIADCRLFSGVWEVWQGDYRREREARQKG